MFQNPFLLRREARPSNASETSTKTVTRQQFGKSGRSNSAPGSYDWMAER